MARLSHLAACSLCPHISIDEALLPALEKMLPEEHNYVVCHLKAGSNGEFSAELRVNITTKEQAKQWLNKHQLATKVAWRSEINMKRKEVRVLYKKLFRCQHNTKPRSETADERRGSKNTNCAAQLKITINKNTFTKQEGKKEQLRKSRSKDPHRMEYPTEIVLKHRHNHPIEAASALKHRDVLEITKENVDCLLLEGYHYGPSAALEKIKFDMQTDDPDHYITKSGDRAFCPDNQWMYRRRQKLGTEKYGKTNTEDLKAFVESVNEQFVMGAASRPQPSTQDGDSHINVDYVRMIVKDGQTVLVICTPLMRRVHESVKHSGEMVFMDATGNLEKGNFRVFLLMTNSFVGGLPLGVMITSGETVSVIKTGLKILVEMVGENGFYGRGVQGPEIFLTDDCRAEKSALGEVFPEAKHFLCAFHLLQAFWRFIWDQKSGVERRLRPHVFGLVKAILYAECRENVQILSSALRTDEVMQRFPNVLAYVEKNLLSRMDSWVICFRKGLLVRGNHTNNFCEAAMRILKDQILRRTKAFSVQQLLDYIVVNLEDYYTRRCVDIGNNQLSRVQESRYLMDLERINGELITQVGSASELLFDVRSSRDPAQLYRVDMSVGLCTCRSGNTGGPCKHQAGIVLKYNVKSWNFIPEADPEMRQLICFIGTGQMRPIEWFQNLRCGSQNVDVGGVTNQDQDVDSGGVTDQGQEVEGSDVTKQGLNVDSDGVTVHGQDVDNGDIVRTHRYEDSDLSSRLQMLMESWMKKLKEDGEMYREGVEAFVKNAKRCTTAVHLNSAWHTFGKYSGFSHSRTERLVSSRRIGVQPTAIQRRRGTLPGCKHTGLGRPSLKRSGQKLSEAVMPKAKRQKAPHNLAACVAVNSSLGKTHSQK